MENLFAYNPDTKSFVPAEEWLKDADPTRTPLVGIKSGAGILAIMKSDFGRYEFEEAQKKAAKLRMEGIDKEFRLPTRREVIDIQDAQDAELGLNDLLEKVGGGALEGWHWTSELWFARRSNAYYAWIFSGTSGNLTSTNVAYALRCRAVTLFTVREAD